MPTDELPQYTSSKPDWSLIPDHMIYGVRRYIENGIGPGSFLTAVICNDLKGACKCADDVNRYRIFEYVQFFYAYCPSNCWGSPEKYEEWIKRGGLRSPDVA